MRVFLSAGEASGDAYAGALVMELKRLHPGDDVFEGLGGRRLREAGARLIADTGDWGAISIVQSLKTVPRVLRGYYRAKARLRGGTPGLFVPIDFGYVNVRLARHAKNRGWRVLYFVPPRSWNRERQGPDLPAISDAISTPFSWSAELLRKAGANAHWFGHPIRQLLGARTAESRGDGLAILPGSRRHEISENLPLIAETLRRLHAPSVEFGLAPSIDVDKFRVQWRRLAPERDDDTFTVGDSVGVLARGRAAIVCSGTVTLEAALTGCPMVVVYRVSRLVELEASLLRFRRPRFIALPNILLDRFAVPELVQSEATPDAVAGAVRDLLPDGSVRHAQLDAFAELATLLGPSDAITKTAELALSLCAGNL